ncbi:MAG: DUF2309 domain-containing protein, partial [Gammaproteobacteria bacterium]|nr:DUF2309 domain-containing protein [Gammaproteobacteria bacterium]
MAAILNRPEIRARLAADGIAIPDDTLFVAARHDTTTDEVVLFDRAELPASHEDDLDALQAALARAGYTNRARRGAQMNAEVETVRSRSRDAAEVRPEWGLARNAAFIVAPRERTLGAPLDGRAFLHSYDWRVDTDGDLLETIMTAPMIVAQWINSQYYFSTVDNATFGSGSKTTQNVVGGCAIMQGNQSDLRLGLPLQSVIDENGQPFHEPQRLLVVIEAPLNKVTDVIEKHEQVAQLFDNEWLMLSVLDPQSGHFYRYQPGGYWYSEAVAA